MELGLYRLCLSSSVLHLDQPSFFFPFHEHANMQTAYNQRLPHPVCRSGLWAGVSEVYDAVCGSRVSSRLWTDW